MHKTFREWLRVREGFLPIDEPYGDVAGRPDLQTAGTNDTANLPMGMRRSATTSAFQSYSLPKIKKKRR